VIEKFGEIAIHLLDSAGTLLVTFVVLWIIYTLTKSVYSSAKKIFNGESKK